MLILMLILMINSTEMDRILYTTDLEPNIITTGAKDT